MSHASQITLIPPDHAHLPAFADALEKGWSPDNTVDVSGKFLAAIKADPDAFLADLVRTDGVVIQSDGTTRPKLPNLVRWLWDGAFCGSISLRWQRGTDALPPYVPGHIGYTVVPWKRRKGYATEALRMMLIEAQAVGLGTVEITTDVGNDISRRVIERCGGVYVETFDGPLGGVQKLRYRIGLAG
jgi:predicted acetyltransferase